VAVQKESIAPLMGAGSVLQLLRGREGMTRSDLARITGLARSTVAQRVDDALLAHELVYEAGGRVSTGGRPPTLLTFNQSAGIVGAAIMVIEHVLAPDVVDRVVQEGAAA
jgi:hypothetical protein